MWKVYTQSLPSSVQKFDAIPGSGVTVDEGATRLAQKDDRIAFIIIPEIEDGKVVKGSESSVFEGIASEVSLEVYQDDMYNESMAGMSVGTRLTFTDGKWRKITNDLMPCYCFGEVVSATASDLIVYFRGTCRSELVELESGV